MSEDVDWEAYVRGTASRYVTRYLAYAETHDQPTVADYSALEAEQPTILAAMERAYQDGQWEQVRLFMGALDGSGTYLRTRGYWGELRAGLEWAVCAAEAEGGKKDTLMYSIV